jgi:hypothetical protein
MVAHHRIDAIHRDLAMEIFLKSMTCGVVHQLAATAICDVSHLTGVAEIEVHIGAWCLDVVTIVFNRTHVM